MAGRKRRPKFRDHGVANEVHVSGSRVPVHVERSTLEITRERGANIRVREVEGGTHEIRVVDERGRRRRRRDNRLHPNEMNRIQQELQAQQAQRKQMVDRIVGGSAEHKKYIDSLKSARTPGGILSRIWGAATGKGKAGANQPSNVGSFPPMHPLKAADVLKKSIQYPHTNKKGTVYTSRRRETNKRTKMDELKAELPISKDIAREIGIPEAELARVRGGFITVNFSETLQRVLAGWTNTTNVALGELQRRPTDARLITYKNTLAEADKQFKIIRGLIEQAYRTALVKKKIRL